MENVNPYVSPKTPMLKSGSQEYVTSDFRDRCPVCNGIIDPWKVGNSIRSHRCSDCNAPLSMGISKITSAVCIAFPIALLGIEWFFLPWNTVLRSCGLVGLGMTLVNIYVRILFGLPTAKQADSMEEPVASIDQKSPENKLLYRSVGSAAS
jgi:hypothetical protein